MSISVIIPAYNAAQFIAETLESVLSQTLPPDEVIVIDDGSKDETAQIAGKFGSPVRVVRRANAGQAVSRNFGVQEAKSEWIAFLDADDLWKPEKLAQQMEELARNPLADLCYTARFEFLEEAGIRKPGNVISVPSPENLRKALFRNTTFLPSSTIIRRSAFLAAGGFDTQFKIVEDWDLWLRLLHSGIIFAARPEPLLLYRIHSNSISHRVGLALLEAKQIYRTHVLPHEPASTRWLAHMKSQSGQEAAAAVALRRIDDPGHLAMMLKSILRFPFDKPLRYKIFAHMLYTRARSWLG